MATAELDKTIVAPEAGSPEGEKPQSTKLRGIHFKKRLILFGGLAIALSVILTAVGGIAWKLRSTEEASSPAAVKQTQDKPVVPRGGPLDVRPPLPDIRPKLHMLPPDQVYRAPRTDGELPKAEDVQAPVPVEVAKATAPPAEASLPEAKPETKAESAPAVPQDMVAKPAPEAPAPGKPAGKTPIVEKPVEKAPEAPVSIFVTRKEKRAVGDCTVEAKRGTDQKELRTRGLTDCIKLFNETDRPPGK
jgi:hypothetical protein